MIKAKEALRGVLKEFGMAIIMVKLNEPPAPVAGMITTKFCGAWVDVELEYVRPSTVEEWSRQCRFLSAKGVVISEQDRNPSSDIWQGWMLRYLPSKVS